MRLHVATKKLKFGSRGFIVGMIFWTFLYILFVISNDDLQENPPETIQIIEPWLLFFTLTTLNIVCTYYLAPAELMINEDDFDETTLKGRFKSAVKLHFEGGGGGAKGKGKGKAEGPLPAAPPYRYPEVDKEQKSGEDEEMFWPTGDGQGKGKGKGKEEEKASQVEVEKTLTITGGKKVDGFGSVNS